jgi:Fanconi anemia group M protein
MDQPKIIVDQRERNLDLLDHLKEFGATVAMATLHIGDYIISDRICVERKTVADFEGSIINGRLFEQAERMKSHYSCPILLLEGDREEFRMHKRAITGAMVSLYVTYGIPVITSESPAESASILVSMAVQEQDSTERMPSPKGGARAYTSAQFQEFIIGNLPGIGPKLAKSLLTHFGTIRSIANASAEELMDVDGVGKKKAGRIYKTLNETYKNDPETA